MRKYGSNVYSKYQKILDDTRSRFGEFLTEKVNPGTYERDVAGSTFTRELMKEAADIGLVSYAMPAAVGGGGASWLEWGVALEMIGYLCVDSSFTLVVAQNHMAHQLICRHGNPEILDEIARPMTKGDRLCAFAYTDADGGSDPFAFSTKVRKDGNHYVLDGLKPIVAGAMLADTILVWATDENHDLQVFAIDRNDPNVDVSPLDPGAMRAGGFGRLFMSGVRLPAHRRLAASDGVSVAQEFLHERKITLVAPGIGRMLDIIENTCDALEETTRFGRPLTELKNVQSVLGRMYSSYVISRMSLYGILERMEEGLCEPLWDPWMAVTKNFIVQQAIELCQDAIRVLGFRVFLRDEMQVERYLRDFLSCLISIGTMDKALVDIGERTIHHRQRTKKLR